MHIHIHPEQTTADGLTPATIDGTNVMLHGYALDAADDGTPMLSLIVSPTSLTLGEKPAERVVTPLRTWGQAARDPREGLPGWSPQTVTTINDATAAVQAQLQASLAEQVARNAQEAAE